MFSVAVLLTVIAGVFGGTVPFQEYGLPAQLIEKPAVPKISKYDFSIEKSAPEYVPKYEKISPVITKYDFTLPESQKPFYEAPLFEIPAVAKYDFTIPEHKPYLETPVITKYDFAVPEHQSYPEIKVLPKSAIITKYDFAIPQEKPYTNHLIPTYSVPEYKETQYSSDTYITPEKENNGEFLEKSPVESGKELQGDFLSKPFGLTPSKALPLLDEFGRPETWGPEVPIESSYNFRA